MTQLVIGLGEVGAPLREILGCDGYDVRMSVENRERILEKRFDVIHICYPYCADFIANVRADIHWFGAALVIIHSTVPIGTTAKINGAVHSPVLGRHASMKEDMRKFRKWVAGPKADLAAGVLIVAGFDCRVGPSSEVTEALKLLSLAVYGSSIAFSYYAKNVLEKIAAGETEWRQWLAEHNSEVDVNFIQPMLWPTSSTIGGHCVLPGTKLLKEFLPDEILETVLRHGNDNQGAGAFSKFVG